METNTFHPNWKALATVHYDYKVFVTERNTNTPEENTEHIYRNLGNITGDDAKRFYEDTIRPKNKVKRPVDPCPPKQQPKHCTVNYIEFNKSKFFKASMNNDVKTLKLLKYTENDINSTDNFGWSALMMAACEESKDSVAFLLKLGISLTTVDKKGNTAESIAKLKGFEEILKLIQESKEDVPKIVNNSSSICKSKTPFYCDICKKQFEEGTMKSHQSSTLHLFNTKSSERTKRNFNISNTNRGLKLMVKQGWDKNSGLGPRSSGQLYPIKTVIRKNRTGLGVVQNPPKVTHFQAYDLDAIKYKPIPRGKTCKQLRKEKRLHDLKERFYRRELS